MCYMLRLDYQIFDALAPRFLSWKAIQGSFSRPISSPGGLNVPQILGLEPHSPSIEYKSLVHPRFFIFYFLFPPPPF